MPAALLAEDLLAGLGALADLDFRPDDLDVPVPARELNEVARSRKPRIALEPPPERYRRRASLYHS
jgi:hypothetical protein